MQNHRKKNKKKKTLNYEENQKVKALYQCQCYKKKYKKE